MNAKTPKTRKLTPNQRRALGIQLSDMPEELPQTLRQHAYDLLKRLEADSPFHTVYLGSTWREVPANVRGQWLVCHDTGARAPVETVRQWTYHLLVAEALMVRP